MSVATPQNISEAGRSKIKVNSVAICAGSGGSLFRGLEDIEGPGLNTETDMSEEEFEIVVSSKDKDPYEFVISGSEDW